MVLFVIRQTDDPDTPFAMLLLLAAPLPGAFLITLHRHEEPLP